jgi:hypothetical protein
MSDGDSGSSLPFPCNVAMVGLYGVGKSSLVRRYLEDTFSHDYHPTMGVQISQKRIRSNARDVDFTLWDLEGKEHREQLQRAYLQHAHAYILVADLTRGASLATALDLQSGIAKLLPGAPFVLALNKSDAPSELGEDQLSRLDPTWRIIRTSARTGQGVEQIFSALAASLLAPDRVTLDNTWHEDEPGELPQEQLEVFRSRPHELRIEGAQPIEVPAGSRELRVSMTMLGGETLETPPLCTIRCTCPMRRRVRCLVVRTETPDRIDAVIELPDGLVRGDEVWCQFEVTSGGRITPQPVRLLIV